MKCYQKATLSNKLTNNRMLTPVKAKLVLLIPFSSPFSTGLPYISILLFKLNEFIINF